MQLLWRGREVVGGVPYLDEGREAVGGARGVGDHGVGGLEVAVDYSF